MTADRSYVAEARRTREGQTVKAIAGRLSSDGHPWRKRPSTLPSFGEMTGECLSYLQTREPALPNVRLVSMPGGGSALAFGASAGTFAVSGSATIGMPDGAQVTMSIPEVHPHRQSHKQPDFAIEAFTLSATVLVTLGIGAYRRNVGQPWHTPNALFAPVRPSEICAHYPPSGSSTSNR